MGKAFDVVLLGLIAISVTAVCLESVPVYKENYGQFFVAIEWLTTVIFTIEYSLRIYCAHRPLGYVFSFFGLVDLIAIFPTYLSILLPGAQSLQVVRILRLVRIFRVFKLARYMAEGHTLLGAVRRSRIKITVFIGVVASTICVVGALMYLIEGPENGFTSIPQSMYWAVVTMTTVGYGDIVPHTVLGKTLTAFAVLIGYGVIAVPTGIVSAELAGSKNELKKVLACIRCETTGHSPASNFCRNCGAKLPD